MIWIKAGYCVAGMWAGVFAYVGYLVKPLLRPKPATMPDDIKTTAEVKEREVTFYDASGEPITLTLREHIEDDPSTILSVCIAAIES